MDGIRLSLFGVPWRFGVSTSFRYPSCFPSEITEMKLSTRPCCGSQRWKELCWATWSYLLLRLPRTGSRRLALGTRRQADCPFLVPAFLLWNIQHLIRARLQCCAQGWGRPEQHLLWPALSSLGAELGRMLCCLVSEGCLVKPGCAGSEVLQKWKSRQ